MNSLFKTLIFSAFILAVSPSWATLKIISVSGVSNVDVNTTTNAVSAIYGGIAGDCTGGMDNITTCNSCVSTAAGTSIEACNLERVYASLPISITFTSDKALNGAIVELATSTDVGDTEGPVLETTNRTEGTPGNPITVTITWGKICDADNNFDSTCAPGTAGNEFNFSNTARKIFLKVDEDANGTTEADETIALPIFLHYIKKDEPTLTQQDFCLSDTDPLAATAYGMCGFKLGVGDQKLVLTNLYGANSGGTPRQMPGAPAWYGVALQAAPGALTTISNSTRPLEVRPYTSSFFIADNTVTGLTNYVNHCLLLGNVNKAKNIYKFNMNSFDPAVVCAEPSEVVGLLEDKSCFISTAAFGSDMAAQVQLLRKFRNQYLIPHSAGRVLVKLYYQVSPPIAHFIEGSEVLKAATRTLLFPVIGLVWLLMNYSVLLILMTLGAIFYVIKKQKAVRHV